MGTIKEYFYGSKMIYLHTHTWLLSLEKSPLKMLIEKMSIKEWHLFISFPKIFINRDLLLQKLDRINVECLESLCTYPLE